MEVMVPGAGSGGGGVGVTTGANLEIGLGSVCWAIIWESSRKDLWRAAGEKETGRTLRDHKGKKESRLIQFGSANN